MTKKIEISEELKAPSEIRYKGKIYKLRLNNLDEPELVPWAVWKSGKKDYKQKTYTELIKDE
jgi:hypothetical protein